MAGVTEYDISLGSVAPAVAIADRLIAAPGDVTPQPRRGSLGQPPQRS